MPGNVSYNPAETFVNFLLCYEVAEYMKIPKIEFFCQVCAHTTSSE